MEMCAFSAGQGLDESRMKEKQENHEEIRGQLFYAVPFELINVLNK